jgi:hypothetical protein
MWPFMESVIDPDESSNSNSKFDTSDCSTDTGEVNAVVAGSKKVSQVGQQFFVFSVFWKLMNRTQEILEKWEALSF